MYVDIKGLDRGEIVAAFFNAAMPKGLGFVKVTDNQISAKQGRALLEAHKNERTGHTYFDYVEGRLLKLDFDETDQLWVDLYDRDNGNGLGAEIIAELRRQQTPTQTPT